jgi:DNA processing protein
MASDLGQHCLLVSSGMAREVDAVAHQGTIDKRTVAGLGGGLDVIYPRQNTCLNKAF